MSSKKALWFALAIAAVSAAALTACGSAENPESAVPVPVASDGVDGGGVADVTVPDSTADRVSANDSSSRESGYDAAATDAPGDVQSDAASDAASVDSFDSGTEAAVPTDAKAPPGAEDSGTSCAVSQAVERRPCGYCGVESRLCAPSGDDAGLMWQPWGECRGQVSSESRCLPGQMRNVPCGLCGAQPQTCQNDCSWAAGLCDQPTTSVCKPGAGDYVSGLSCMTGGRIRYCRNDCTYGDFGDCYDPSKVDGGAPRAFIAIALSTTDGENTVTVTRTMPQFPQIARFDVATFCPEATLASSLLRSFDYVTVKNPDATQAAMVSIWTHAAATNPAPIDTMMAAYSDRSTPPSTDTERSECSAGVVDGCSGVDIGEATACQGKWAAFVDESSDDGDDNRIVLGPGESAVLYVGGKNATDFGDYQVSVRTDVLQ